MARRNCPVCRTGKILRADIRTCSPRCSQEWRNWSSERRSKAELDANKPIEMLTDEEIDQWRADAEAERLKGLEKLEKLERVGASIQFDPPMHTPIDPTDDEGPDFDSIIKGKEGA